jgi:hypothetical protein
MQIWWVKTSQGICMDIPSCYIASDCYAFDVRDLNISFVFLIKINLLVKSEVEQARYVGLFLPSVKR